MRAHIVIGAGWGDEGKGLVTDWLASRLYESGRPPVVVRFNGGAQAGHTVVTPSGRRHTFSHFGSGTLAGASTHLGPEFIINPILFLREEKRLRALLGETRAISANPDCIVTTPYDMMLNVAAEQARGDGRHGSCGVGINETVVRSALPEFRITIGSINGLRAGSFVEERLRDILLRVRHTWLPRRANELGIALDTLLEAGNDGLIPAFIADCRMAARYMDMYQITTVSAGSDCLIFEGAQGLRLDAESPDFPHVTRSRTGLTNVLPMLAKLGIDEADVYYVTRAYATRHGAGPLPHEEPGLSYPDETNIPNSSQGTMRFGRLDYDGMVAAIRKDMAQAAGRVTLRPHVVMTCVDQVGGRLEFPTIGAHTGERLGTFGKIAAHMVAAELAVDIGGDGNGWVSSGPTRLTMERVPPFKKLVRRTVR